MRVRISYANRNIKHNQNPNHNTNHKFNSNTKPDLNPILSPNSRFEYPPIRILPVPEVHGYS